jgi:hypothetical protein
MGAAEIPTLKKPVLPSVERQPACTCGSEQFYVVHSLAVPGGKVSTMFECVKCGEYRL